MNQSNSKKNYCDVCRTQYSTKYKYDTHLDSKKHFENVNIGIKYVGKYECPICKKIYVNKYNFSNHLKAIHHLDDSRIGELLKVETPEQHFYNVDSNSKKHFKNENLGVKHISDFYFCEICGLNVRPDLADEHLKSTFHLKNAQKLQSINSTNDNVETYEQPFYSLNSNSKKHFKNENVRMKTISDFYFCEICGMNFRPEFVDEHLKSTFHLKNAQKFQPIDLTNDNVEPIDLTNDNVEPIDLTNDNIQSYGQPTEELKFDDEILNMIDELYGIGSNANFSDRNLNYEDININTQMMENSPDRQSAFSLPESPVYDGQLDFLLGGYESPRIPSPRSPRT